jgi:hypothetical protein
MELDELNVLLAFAAAAPYAAEAAYRSIKRSGAGKAIVRFLHNQFTQIQH